MIVRRRVVAAAAGLLLVLAPRPSPAEPVFLQAFQSYAVPHGGLATALRDMNNDSHFDLVVLGGDGFVSIFAGDGSGHFSDPRRFRGDGAGGGTYITSRTMAMADVNSDGTDDVIVADYNSANVLLGDGHGGLERALVYDMGSGPTEVQAADFDGDGIVDIITFDAYPGTLSFRAGRGEGSFRARRAYRGGTYLFDAVTSDIDADGDPDLVVANGLLSDSLTIFWNDGRAGFDSTTQVQLTPGSPPYLYAIALGDVNGDGYPDIAANSYEGDSELSIHLGHGDGTFESVGSFPSTYGALTILDYDGDGFADVLNNSNGLYVWRGHGDGQFDPGGRLFAGNGNGAPQVADLNGDGHLDMAAEGDVGALVALSEADGSFPVIHGYSLPYYSVGSTLTDLDGDGNLDVVGARWDTDDAGGDLLFFLPGDGSLGLGPMTTWPLPAFPGIPVAGDWNMDGHADVMVAVRSSRTILLFAGQGDGTLVSKPGLMLPGGPGIVLLNDFDEDGRNDIAALSGPNTLSIFLGRPDESWEPRPDHETSESPVGLIAADFNNDSHVDLVVATDRQGITLAWYPGLGDGHFGEPILKPFGSLFGRIAAGDFDGDSRLDLALAHSDSLTVLTGQGNGQFERTSTRPLGGFPRWLHVLDVNDDGRMDVVAGIDASTFPVFLGVGNGDFAEPIYQGHGGGWLSFGDMDRDGRVDVVVTQSRSLHVLGNVSRALPQPGPFTAALDGWNVELSWTWPEPQARFDIYRKSGGESWQKLNAGLLQGSTTFQYTDAGLTRPGIYSYQLRHVDDCLHRMPVSETTIAFSPAIPAPRVVHLWPNPTRASVALEYELPAPAPVRLEIFDLQGRSVTSLDAGVQPAGRSVVNWDGTNRKGRPCPAGIYFLRLNGAAQQRRITLVR